MTQRLSDVDWTQLFLAIDRLSRSGDIALWSLEHRDYRVKLKRAAWPVERQRR